MLYIPRDRCKYWFMFGSFSVVIRQLDKNHLVVIKRLLCAMLYWKYYTLDVVTHLICPTLWGRYILFSTCFKIMKWDDFPGGPVVRTLCFHCRVLGLIPCWGPLSDFHKLCSATTTTKNNNESEMRHQEVVIGLSVIEASTGVTRTQEGL